MVVAKLFSKSIIPSILISIISSVSINCHSTTKKRFPFFLIYLSLYLLSIDPWILNCILWVIICTVSIYFETQSVLDGVSSSWLLTYILLEHLYFLAQQDVPGSSGIFPTPLLKSALSSKNPDSFPWRMVFRFHDLDTKFAYLYWDALNNTFISLDFSISLL